VVSDNNPRRGSAASSGAQDICRAPYTRSFNENGTHLKQEQRQWNAIIDAFLIDELYFQSSPYDPCLYVQYQKGTMVITARYIDDLVLASSVRQLLDWLRE